MDLIYWLLLLKAPQLGIRTFYKALAHFETPEQVFLATANMRAQSGLFKKVTLDYLAMADADLAQADLDWQQNSDCFIITLIDKGYPEHLKTISDPPPVLYVRGNIDYLSKPQIAIVGSRNPTPGGEKNAYQFAADLSALGVVVVSGLASGIDASAHIGALEAGFPTVAVCGTGLDRIYPARHKALAHQIISKGALISEFSLGTGPLAINFPRRNRVISGLSLGTLVVEASIKSGTMITAKLAAEQGREVFAMPGSIHNPLSSGCHQLIKDGAKLTDSIADIVQELSLDISMTPASKKSDIETKKAKKANNSASVLLKYLSYDTMSVDALVEKSTLSPQIITQELLLLELEGKVAKADGAGWALIK